MTLKEMADFVQATMNAYEKADFTFLGTNLQRYTVLPQLFRKRQREWRSGNEYKFKLQMNLTATARGAVPTDPDLYSTNDSLVEGTGVMRLATASWSLPAPDIAMNIAEHRIVDMVEMRVRDMMIDTANLIENYFWGMPAGTSDALRWRGVFYWLVYNATEGFTGGDHSLFTSGPANVSSTTYDRWKNYAGQYTSFSDDDAVEKIKRGLKKTNFISPVSGPYLGMKTGGGPDYMPNRPDFEIFTIDDNLQVALRMAKAQNDNLGSELAPYGSVTINGARMYDIPYLTDNYATSAPIIGIYWPVWHGFYQKGYFLKKGPVHPIPLRHLLVGQHMDSIGDIVCRNRRSNFLFAKSDPTA